MTDYDAILARQDVPVSEPVAKRYFYVLPVNDFITVPSGYAAVTADIGGEIYHLINTHLDAGAVEDIRLG